MEKKVLLFFVVIIVLIIAINITVFILTKENFNDFISSPIQGNCTPLIENNGENKIDIVFLTENLDKQKIQEYIDFFLSSEPFNKHPEKFNFYYSNYNAECELVKDTALYCYSKSLIRNSATCPNDYIIVLADRPSKIRSSAYLNLISLNINHNKNVVLHEFGHIFAKLADEYVPSKIPRGAENCAKECEDFNQYDSLEGCYEGCSKSDYFRSSENSVMRTLNSKDYGNLNLKILNENLEEYE